jgi:heme oxygenase
MTLTADAVVSTGFAAELKAATQEVHDAAERSPFVARLLGGEAPLDEYVLFLAQLHAIYAELERAADVMRADPVAGAFAEPALTRLPALEADLAALAGDGWAERLEPTAATTTLVTHIGDTCFDWPGGFVAHHYVRYLGDLSGGQIMRRIIERVYGFEHHVGTRFFVFDHLDNGVQFKKRYRTLLDEAPWDDAERRRVIAEAITAFELNTAVFDSLA